MVLDFSLELKDVEGKYKDVENRLKEKQEGEVRYVSFWNVASIFRLHEHIQKAILCLIISWTGI